MDVRYLKPLTRTLLEASLEAPHALAWQYMGFGMFRHYPGGEKDRRVRLNVWMPSTAVKDVSLVHDHPWDFESTVLSGELRNFRYREASPEQPWGDLWAWAYLQTGPGGGIKGSPKVCKLFPVSGEVYRVGDTYSQRSFEIHKTVPTEGAVTINERIVPPGGDPDGARVFWPVDKDWVSAEPRWASASEIAHMARVALEAWR